MLHDPSHVISIHWPEPVAHPKQFDSGVLCATCTESPANARMSDEDDPYQKPAPVIPTRGSKERPVKSSIGLSRHSARSMTRPLVSRLARAGEPVARPSYRASSPRLWSHAPRPRTIARRKRSAEGPMVAPIEPQHSAGCRRDGAASEAARYLAKALFPSGAHRARAGYRLP